MKLNPYKVPLQKAAESGAMCKSFKEKKIQEPRNPQCVDGENQGFLSFL